MTTDEIAEALELTGKLMELHDENPFKAKGYLNAAFRLSKSNPDLQGKTKEEIEKIEGIGKSISGKIVELLQTGGLKELNQLMESTPAGVIDMMGVKGIGPKKVRQLWKELEIESVGELLYACNENRLVELKGFGAKTQEAVKKSIEFKQLQANKMLYARIINEAESIVKSIREKINSEFVSLTGEIYRKCEVIDKIEILIGVKEESNSQEHSTLLEEKAGVPVELIYCNEKDFYFELVKTSSHERHFESLNIITAKGKSAQSEKEIYSSLGLQFAEPELREGLFEIDAAKNNSIPELIKFSDLKGSLHNHSKYSDGQHTLEQMAMHCQKLGYEYFGIADHSQTAVYADGLKPERVFQQHEEIDKLNEKLAPFRILKGIESDILNDGSLDYDDDVLQTFDYVVASIHQNFKMDEKTATARLITAIENPFTTILGHPTGRLLLSRPGYPIDHKKIIDACAANGVIMELNSHPYRLDIDWRWIPYCLEKGVMISLNPDAHHIDGFHDMYYGVCAARKGMLTKEMCFNAKTLREMEDYLSERLR